MLERIGKYRVIREIGKGATATVYLCKCDDIEEMVAVKLVDFGDKNRDQGKWSRRMRKLFLTEAAIASRLDHPNIIAYFKHFISEDMLYIELEYAKGGNLANLIRQQKYQEKYFEEETVLWYLFQLSSAIAYIHDLGIMHRDIKALNIFIMQNGLLKLGDFGIAKVLEANDGLAESVSQCSGITNRSID